VSCAWAFVSASLGLFPNPLLHVANIKQLFALAWVAYKHGWDKKSLARATIIFL